MSDSSKPTSSLSSLVDLAKADLSTTVSLYFRPVTVVVGEVAKAMRGNLNPNSAEATEDKSK